MNNDELLAFIMRVLSVFDRMDSRDDLLWRTPASAGPGQNFEPIKFAAMCSDVFWWGTADSEDITPENIGLLEQALADVIPLVDFYERHRAVILFAARVRGMRPQGAMYKYIDQKLWHLFDAAGPVREAGMANPYDRPPDPETTHGS